MKKLSSLKFWMAVGGSATGIASIVSGIAIPSEKATLALTIVGAVLMAVSVVAYNFAEAYVDGKSAESNVTVTETTNSTAVSASTTSANTVDKLLAKEPEELKVGGTS